MEAATEKTCFKCGQSKPRSEYYAHPMMGDGLLGKCKDCTKLDVRRTRAANLDTHRDRDRKRWPSKKASMRERGVAGAPRSREYADAWAARNPEKRRAQHALMNAVRDGRVTREPCFVCGERAHGHHEDYSRPLDVVWLCAEHHAMWHRLKREVARVMGRGA